MLIHHRKLSICNVSYHFEDHRVINDILAVFIHSHDEWFVKCWKDICLDRRNFWNGTIIKIIQKIQYFSIHIWLKLLREYTSQYDCMIALLLWQQSKCFLEKKWAPVVLFPLYGFLWSFGIQYKQITHHVPC